MTTKNVLYYPNIKIPNENWLKSNLLMFPSVSRIIPDEFVDNSSFVKPYIESGMLKPADIYSYGVYRAQDRFLHKAGELFDKNPDYLDLLKVGNAQETDGLALGNVHIGKLGSSVADFLHSHDLIIPDENGFILMHPALSEAIMSTIAISCAEEDGSDIITENGKLHSWLSKLDTDAAFDALLSDKYILSTGDISVRNEKRGSNSLSMVLFANADLKNLSAENLSNLADEQGALVDLKERLSELSRELPLMRNTDLESEALRDLASDIIGKWNSDRNNLSNFWKTFFSSDLHKKADGFFQKLGAPLAIGLASGAGAAAFTEAKVLAAGIGFGIGLISHTAKSWSAAKKIEKDSPYRYLSRCEDNGIVWVSQ